MVHEFVEQSFALTAVCVLSLNGKPRCVFNRLIQILSSSEEEKNENPPTFFDESQSRL